MACGSPQPPPALAPGLQRPDAWCYEVRAEAGAERVVIEAEWPRWPGDQLSYPSVLAEYLELPEVWEDGQWLTLEGDGSGRYRLPEPGDPESRVRVRYALALKQMAEDRAERSWARWRDDVLQVAPIALLLRPMNRSSERVRLALVAQGPWSWVSGIQLAADDQVEADAATSATTTRTIHETSSRWFEHSPFTALGRYDKHHVEIEGCEIELAVPVDADLRVDTEELLTWVEESARRVSEYYDCFPVPRLLIALSPQGRRSLFGVAQGNGGASVHVAFPRRTSARDLERDWVLTHELVHTGMPGLAPAHDWLEEGMATYVEAVVRARAGRLDPQDMWSSFRRSMPYGQPDDDEGGLDGTRSWGRIYWGGAMFCMWIDIELRRASDNAIGLEHCLRGIQDAGGDARQRWSMQQTIDAMEAGSGLGVVTDLYSRVDDEVLRMPLNELLDELGVAHGAGLDDEAPLAHVRRAIEGSSP